MLNSLRESSKIAEQEKAKINAVIKALNKLSPQDQRLIAYTYFENKNQIEVAALMRIDERTVRRKLNKIALDIGRIIYGFEDEFINILDEAWNALNDVEFDETEEELLSRAVAFVTNKMKEYKVIS